MDRTPDELLFRVPHTVLHERGLWRVWYGGGSRFDPGRHKTLPVYDVRYMESDDGVTFSNRGTLCVPVGPGEQRIGRPYVLRWGNGYRMFYGYGTETTVYRLGFADSPDGVHWRRRDAELGVDVSTAGWDSEMVAYPSVIRVDAGTYLFYNGNGYGRDGFGIAALEADE